MIDYIIIAIIVLAVGSATFYIYKEKKKGRKCIGCPYSGGCTSCSCKKTDNSNK